MSAARSVVALVRSQATAENVVGLVESSLPFDISLVKKLPALGSIQFSLPRLILGRELPSIIDVYFTYRPHYDPKDSIPPANKYAYFVNGGYIHTFDGRQYVFPGTCSYILAQDMQDGNFSIVANYKAGQLISVTLTEPNESVTIKTDGSVSQDNFS